MGLPKSVSVSKPYKRGLGVTCKGCGVGRYKGGSSRPTSLPAAPHDSLSDTVNGIKVTWGPTVTQGQVAVSMVVRPDFGKITRPAEDDEETLIMGQCDEPDDVAALHEVDDISGLSESGSPVPSDLFSEFDSPVLLRASTSTSIKPACESTSSMRPGEDQDALQPKHAASSSSTASTTACTSNLG